MANGIAKPLLDDLMAVAGGAYPGVKVDAHGFLGMVITNTAPGDIKVNSAPGHKQQVDIKYKQRYTKAQTDTALSCDNVLTPSWLEATVAVNNVRQIAMHWNDETIASYMRDASVRQGVPGATPGTTVVAEILTDIQHAANAIMDGVNDDLLGLLTWGKNRVTGASTATALNFSSDTSVQKFTEGFPRLLGDYRKNNLTGRPQIVGAGNFANVALAQAMRSGADQFGYDYRIALAGFDFWMDQNFDDVVGSNVIGVFEPGAVKMVEYNRYTGDKAGNKGVSEFFQIVLPYVDPLSNIVVPVRFDAQLKYDDCGSTYTDAYSGQSVSLEKGYNLILSKTFGLFQIPSDAYRHEDAQRSVNGALRYTVTTNCDTCA